MRVHLRVRAILAVAAGGCAGGAARYLTGLALPEPAEGFPTATFGVNLLGCFLLALLLVLLQATESPILHLREFAGIGVLGSFTTFGTWMVQLDQRVHAEAYWVTVGYLMTSLIGGLTAAVLGVAAGRVLTTRSR